jgi:hypothetical protein
MALQATYENMHGFLPVTGNGNERKSVKTAIVQLYTFPQIFYSFTCSDFSLGFHTLTPMKPPTPDTAMITAKTIRYDNTILKNSIKFVMILPHIPPQAV